MSYLDGSEKSGSGTIVRYAVALSSLLGEKISIYNIRAKRDKPGLRPQHLGSIMACANMCDAVVEGAKINSTSISYTPGPKIRGGYYEFNIGTAGSCTLLAFSLLPLALFASEPTTIRITGGLFQDFAPSAHHMQNVLFPLLRKMGAEVNLEVVRPGYVPAGGGVIEIKVKPVSGVITPLVLQEQGEVKEIKGFALSSRLKEQKVSQRMADVCTNILRGQGYRTRITNLWDETALQAGANLAVWATTDTDCLVGSDQAGKRGRSSELIGRNVAYNLLEDLQSGATVDRYLADQLIIFAAIASGETEYIIPKNTDHIEDNRWLVEK
ncbi:MAG: RNA 3'-phosphate cyclase, partial [Dehalococcoidales bacterium]